MRVLILGNGFDLNMGLKTSYKDFAKNNWPHIKYIDSDYIHENIIDFGEHDYSKTRSLEYYLGVRRSETNNWIDLEQELLNYAKKKEDDMGDSIRFLHKEEDFNFFQALKSSLQKHISEEEKKEVIRDSVAAMVFNTMIESAPLKSSDEPDSSYPYYFPSLSDINIYSFNYTDLKSLAHKLGINQKFQYHHLHGCIADDSIILGVDETPLCEGYEYLHKTSSKHYASNDMLESLSHADEVVFFGLSFGKIDYSYFSEYFSNIAAGLVDSRPYITIFTKDDNSEENIKTNLRLAGINMQNLYGKSFFEIICTDRQSPVDSKKFEEFLSRNKGKKSLE